MILLAVRQWWGRLRARWALRKNRRAARAAGWIPNKPRVVYVGELPTVRHEDAWKRIRLEAPK